MRVVSDMETMRDISPYFGYKAPNHPAREIGHGPAGRLDRGAGAVPAGGFATRSRAAPGISLPALRLGREVLRWTGTGEGG